MKKYFMTVIVLISIPVMAFAMGKNDSPKGVVELTIPHYKTGQNVGAKFFLPQVERFNKKYDGQYHITIEGVPQEGYSDKIKILAQQNKLPALIEGAEAGWFKDVIIANNRAYDLKHWLDSHPEISSVLLDDSVRFVTNNGKIEALPYAVTRPIGLFYNKTMITPKKPIGQMNHTEFLQALGKQKMAFMTSENAWTTTLFFTSLIAVEPGGPELLRQHLTDKIYDFTDPAIVNATVRLQKILQEYATGNTVGATYADAANSFMSKQAAVIFNGPWMAGDFDISSKDKWSNGFSGEQVKGDVYPGNSAISNNTGFWWWIPSGLPKEETDAALAFLGFIASPDELEAFMLAEGGVAPNLKVSEEFLNKQKSNRLLSELANAVNSETKLVPLFLDIVPPSIGGIEWGKLLPKLIDGSFTPIQFLRELGKKAKETRL